jgi:hypothetical protein
MPFTFIPLYATLALALGAILTVPYFAIPALADSPDGLQLGFLDSIDDPSRLHVVTAKAGGEAGSTVELADIPPRTSALQRGLGPVWIWNPPSDSPAPAIVASR